MEQVDGKSGTTHDDKGVLSDGLGVFLVVMFFQK
jgi:hypothetical protein